MMPISPWYVVCTAPNAERIAKLQFEREGIETLLLLRELPPTDGKPVNVVPLWPGYLFVRATFIPQRAYQARHLIRDLDGEAVPVPPGVLEYWIERADADGLVNDYRYIPPPSPFERTYVKGDIVRVTEGHMMGAFLPIARNHYRGQSVACDNGGKLLYLRAEQVVPVETGTVPYQGVHPPSAEKGRGQQYAACSK
jgi:transcription antitermination factor NusG